MANVYQHSILLHEWIPMRLRKNNFSLGVHQLVGWCQQRGNFGGPMPFVTPNKKGHIFANIINTILETLVFLLGGFYTLMRSSYNPWLYKTACVSCAATQAPSLILKPACTIHGDKGPSNHLYNIIIVVWWTSGNVLFRVQVAMLKFSNHLYNITIVV